MDSRQVIARRAGGRVRGKPWSEKEVRLAVEDYFDMLRKELCGEKFFKSHHNEALRVFLDGRSKTSVEKKHENISAVLDEMSMVFIDGYKPLRNYQDLLMKVVQELLPTDLKELADRQLKSIPERSHTLQFVDPDREVDAPKGGRQRAVYDRARAVRPVLNFDYLERDAANHRLGELGEKYVLEVERMRLDAAGRSDLARAVQWTAKEIGDGVGYDIRSFTMEGDETFVEVKTTNRGLHHAFLVTRGEVRASERLDAKYRLVRVFDFSKGPQFYTLQGAVPISCDLTAELFRARPA